MAALPPQTTPQQPAAAAAAGTRGAGRGGEGPGGVDTGIFQRCLAIAESRLLNEALLRDEFMSIKEQDHLIDQTTQVAMRQASRNRYSNVHPYDYNRVQLAGAMDYINASHIVLPDPLGFKLRYIAAQGPTPKTVEDFWRMVVEQHVVAITMVTNLVENRMTKCALYYPENEGDSITAGKLQIRVVKLTRASSALTVRELEVARADGGRGSSTRRVFHFHYQAWPDHGSPQESLPIWQISHALDELRGGEGQQPVLVHCSAGIGRTGTFCALDLLRHRLDALQRRVDPLLPPHGGSSNSAATADAAAAADVAALMDIPALVHELRRQRGGMVQSLEQYVFIYQALVEELRQRCQAMANGRQRS